MTIFELNKHPHFFGQCLLIKNFLRLFPKAVRSSYIWFKGTKHVLILVLLIYVFSFSCITPVLSKVDFSSETIFSIPEYGNQLSFQIGGSYESVILENKTWNFVGLALDNYVLNLTEKRGWGGVLYGRDVLDYSPNDGNFSVLLENCNITITHYDIVTQFAPYSGWLNYSVSGTGSQTFNLHYFQPIGGWTGPNLWTVYVDGVSKPQNENWGISGTERIITISGATNNVSIFYDSTSIERDGPLEPDSSSLQLIIFVSSIIILIIIGLLLLNRKMKK
ncbi:MAG: hypothetical protein CW716_03760 [Candidatus Bathyarchaeum sp.]|nr:MAG: hypothetical protein CW716_03760 [Candidatus Bathyarchaeum sp.]